MDQLRTIRHACVTDVGRQRARNEDHWAVIESKPGGGMGSPPMVMLAVADGMGGHSCGELASRMACEGLPDFFRDRPADASPAEDARRLDNLFHALDAAIRARGSAEPRCAHMGTTLSALLIDGRAAVLAHVGDSRIYRLRGDRLALLTTDHTFVQEMIDEGELPREAASVHPLRNVLTQAVGTQEALSRVDTAVLGLAEGDRFLLSSDGLHDLVPFEAIRAALAGSAQPAEAAEGLLQLALDHGGRDNITALVAFV